MTKTGRQGGARGERGSVLLHSDQLVVLVFEIERHRYGIETATLSEIVRAVQPIRLPKAPAVVLGLINVRGTAVPLIDLRLRFGLAQRPVRSDEVFLLARARGRSCALRADVALELVRVPRASIVPAPERVDYLAGTAVLDDGLLLICDLDTFLDQAELASLDAALEAAP
jgi:purine-binding chemotaxis protein CheW